MKAAQGFGARVLQLIAERQATTGRKVTARSVAADLDIPEGSLSRYISKKTPPPDRVTTPMAKYFGVYRGWLRYGEGEKYAPKGGTKVADLDAGDGPMRKAGGG